jgi:EAL domain-containing protein (putative c-di-GMP-specific phosphodiesterase class I)
LVLRWAKNSVKATEAGCDAAQGFLVGRPTPEKEITTLLLAHSGLAKQLD